MFICDVVMLTQINKKKIYAIVWATSLCLRLIEMSQQYIEQDNIISKSQGLSDMHRLLDKHTTLISVASVSLVVCSNQQMDREIIFKIL